jgi:hypothetical protein
MLKFNARNFIGLTHSLGRIETILEDGKNETVPPTSSLVGFLDQLTKDCEQIGLEFSILAITAFKAQLTSKGLQSTICFNKMLEIKNRVFDEIKLNYFFVIPQQKATDYYEKANLFGDEVFNKFPSANFDIEEAGKCFATARYTACVMHLQRVLEVGLKAYGNCLGVMNLITTTQPSWQTVLDKTAKEIKDRNDKQNTNTDWALPEERDFCEGIQPFLLAVKTAWRNPSMHADKTYGEEIAEDIFSAVKRFMKHLAEHIDEAGTFTP